MAYATRSSLFLCRRLVAGAASRVPVAASKLGGGPATCIARRWLSAGGVRASGVHTLNKPQLPPLVTLSDEVAEAMERGAPVVALESTIISHGMPYPANLETAREVEAIVRDGGAVPATVAVLGGRVRVGLADAELQRVATTGRDARKCSRRDLAVVAAAGGDAVGATTVAGTMVAAAAAGVDVFVTGGIGGVHRGYAETMDASADIVELGRTRVAVVCAGAKSILDIARTLELLETHGVTVAAVGTDDFPAFFTPSSGHAAHVRVESAADAAAIVDAGAQLGLESGVVVALPNWSAGAAGAKIEAAIEQALRDADERGIRGKEITPFLLARVNELTEGASLKTNIELVRNNARFGAAMAVELSRMRASAGASPAGATGAAGGSRRAMSTTAAPTTRQGRPVVVGGAVIDLVAKPQAGKELLDHTSNPGSVEQSYGGVARNAAEAMARLGAAPVFVSAISSGGAGAGLRSNIAELGMSVEHIVEPTAGRTAVYCAVLDGDGDLRVAVADMTCFDDIQPDHVGPDIADKLRAAPIALCDGNLSSEAIGALGAACADARTPLWFEPTSVAKAVRAVPHLHHMAVLSPSYDELLAMAEAAEPDESSESDDDESDFDDLSDDDDDDDDDMEEDEDGSDDDDDADDDGGSMVLSALVASARVLRRMVAAPDGAQRAAVGVGGAAHVVTTLGKRGVVWTSVSVLGDDDERRPADGEPGLLGDDEPPLANADVHDANFELLTPEVVSPVNATGAGDTLAGAAVAALCRGESMMSALRAGMVGARFTLMSDAAVAPDLAYEALEAERAAWLARLGEADDGSDSDE